MIRQPFVPLCLAGLILASWWPAPASAAVPKYKTSESLEKDEGEYYKIFTFDLPRDVVLEAGALERLPDVHLGAEETPVRALEISHCALREPSPL